ncbi:MAG TPA: hypothetical protein VMU21_01200 [Thermodesulfovibrionales bacterium]|nr:hypothetical protein [Thermodesulfovibrionales bacterium]
MLYSEQVIVKRWIPILKEYEKTKAKETPRVFKFIKDLCEAHHISRKELGRYHRKWVQGNRTEEALLPRRRGARPGSRRTPREMERAIIKAYRRFGSNRYELVLPFKPYYLDKTRLRQRWTGSRHAIHLMKPRRRSSNDMKSRPRESWPISTYHSSPRISAAPLSSRSVIWQRCVTIARG